MIGFNGGLLGKTRTTSVENAVGVWSLVEQVRYRAANISSVAAVAAVALLAVVGVLAVLEQEL